ncbi:tetratricopeptide repeat protein [Herbidospora sp. RD11066]
MDEFDTPFKRRLALTMAAVGLFAAFLAYLGGQAGSEEDRHARQAQRAAVAALAAQAEGTADGMRSLGDLATLGTVARRHDIESLRATLLAEPAAPDYGTAPVTGIDLSGLMREARRAAFTQEAAQETATAWGDKSNTYAAGTALLAVALTLLGLSLTVGEGVRRHLLRPGAALVGLTVLATGVTWAIPAPVRSQAAISSAVEGEHLFASRDFDGAVRAYTKAIEADDSFAYAYERRATARVAAANPQRDTSVYVVNVAPRAAYEAAVTDLRAALDQGGESHVALAGMSGHLVRLGDYQAAERYARRAIALNPGPPWPWANLVFALLGQGRVDAARQTFTTLSVVVAARANPVERGELRATIRVGADLLAERHGFARPLAREIKAAMVRAQLTEMLPDGRDAPSVRLGTPTLSVRGATIEAEIPFEGMVEGARLGALAYYREDPGGEWLQRPDLLVPLRWPGTAPTGTMTWPIVDFSCPSKGEYRIEFYADDRLLTTASVTRPTMTDSLTFRPDWPGGLTLCQPAGWTYTRLSSGAADLASPDSRHRLTVRVVTIEPPLSPTLLETVKDQLIATLDAKPTRVEGPLDAVHSGVAGSRWWVDLPGGGRAYVWASISADGRVRTFVARFPDATLEPLTGITDYVRFLF